ncbi:tetratricopeptide repeat protein [Leucothrix pacifica]|uniref:Uncharacterized protein n=1 Tax=Leucothrix pacifica TaxID=1247513 RepID=A0A317CH32_9GAMM|nr:tetratricopeptide repeat protein [Leucothrix pacifica]PWQ97866.1 hypothetical protein DKW60_09310 [Leucothrix pacifica]
MSKAPFELALSYDTVNTSDYPSDAQTVGSTAFNQQLREQLEKQYQSLGGDLKLVFGEHSVLIKWHAGDSVEQQRAQALGFLKAGEYSQAIPLLNAILEHDPNDTDSLYNLGMVYSDQGKLDDAVSLLTKATETDPKHYHAFVALGVAHLRQGQVEPAETALKQALSIESDDPYALRTLAAIHMQKQDYISAISVLRHALSLLPSDSISLLNLATCLFKTGQDKNISEAKEMAAALIATNTGNEIEEKAKDLQRQIGYHQFRKDSGEHENSDAVFYCIDALRRLKDASDKEAAAVALEVAQLGQNGLNINDPEVTYTIKSFPGDFTGLALVCLLHVAVQKVSPGSNSGFDVQEKYEIAKGLFEAKQR